VEGRYHGEIVIIAKCADCLSSSSPAGPESSSACPDLPLPNISDLSFFWDELKLVPQLIYDGSLSATAPHALWTWCQCQGDCSNYDYGDSSPCPKADDCGGAANPSGYWWFRGGDVTLGTPCVNGRFYGETVFIYRCLDASSSTVPEPSSETGDSSCDAPFPAYYIDDASWFDYPSVQGSFDFLSACSVWSWCQCEDNTVFHPYADDGACPKAYSCTESSTGGWVLVSGSADYGPPCYTGRYHGETAFVCECPGYLECPDNCSACGSWVSAQLPSPFPSPFGVVDWNMQINKVGTTCVYTGTIDLDNYDCTSCSDSGTASGTIDVTLECINGTWTVIMEVAVVCEIGGEFSYFSGTWTGAGAAFDGNKCPAGCVVSVSSSNPQMPTATITISV
jgi:hypothetical protein